MSAEITSSRSSGRAAFPTASISAIKSVDSASLPAVSIIIRSNCSSSFLNPWKILTASVPLRSTNTGTPICFPTCSSCAMAAGRWMSSPKRHTRWPRFMKNFASFPAVVVLPEPKRPTSMREEGFFLISILWPSPPRKRTSSSYTMCSRCSFFVSPAGASSLSALSRIFAERSKTSLTLTSACRSARWMSLTSSPTSLSSTKTALAILPSVFLSDSPSFSKTIKDLNGGRYLKLRGLPGAGKVTTQKI